MSGRAKLMLGLTLVVLLALAGLYIVFIPLGGPARTSRISTAIELLRTACQLFAATHGRAPRDLKELRAVGMLREEHLLDPWHKPFRLRTVGGVLSIESSGPDRRFESADDIVNVVELELK